MLEIIHKTVKRPFVDEKSNLLIKIHLKPESHVSKSSTNREKGHLLIKSHLKLRIRLKMLEWDPNSRFSQILDQKRANHLRMRQNSLQKSKNGHLQ